MKFWKMNGAGNDFVIINNMEEEVPEEKMPEMAEVLCERHLSIGADGFMVVGKPSDGVKADCRMHFFNSDGSVGEMCGNGARCISRYCYENEIGLKDGVFCNGSRDTVTIETTAGLVTGKRINKDLYRVRLNDPSVIELEKKLNVDGSFIECAYVVLGDPGIPHLVVDYPSQIAPICGAEHLKDVYRQKLFELGRKLRFHADLPKGANVNFVEVTGDNDVEIMTYERGVEDFTYACGTGTGSSAAVLTLKDLVSGENVRFSMRGGELYMDVEEVDEAESVEIHGLYLTGPTNVVCKGRITDNNLKL